MELLLFLLLLLSPQAKSKSYLIETDNSINFPDLGQGSPTHMGAPNLLSSPIVRMGGQGEDNPTHPNPDGIHEIGNGKIGKGLPIEEANELFVRYLRFGAEWHQNVADSFVYIDKDQNDYITTIELANVLKLLGQNPSNKWLRDIMMENENDQDEDGRVSSDEFLTMMLKRGKYTAPEIRKSFDTYDLDKNGKISTLEYATQMDKNVYLADNNGDGEIDYEEFPKNKKGKGRLRTIGLFIFYDSDKSGKLSRAEIEVDETNMFNINDIDKDGEITYLEYELSV